jgi:hypothetical protein
LAALIRDAGLSLPQDYLEFLTRCNGGSGFLAVQPCYLRLWTAKDVVGNNRDYRMPEFVPGFFGFGDDGGDEFFAFDARGPQPWPVVAIPFAPMEEREARAVAGSFTELLGQVISPEAAEDQE